MQNVFKVMSCQKNSETNRTLILGRQIHLDASKCNTSKTAVFQGNNEGPVKGADDEDHQGYSH